MSWAAPLEGGVHPPVKEPLPSCCARVQPQRLQTTSSANANATAATARPPRPIFVVYCLPVLLGRVTPSATQATMAAQLCRPLPQLP